MHQKEGGLPTTYKSMILQVPLILNLARSLDR